MAKACNWMHLSSSRFQLLSLTYWMCKGIRCKDVSAFFPDSWLGQVTGSTAAVGADNKDRVRILEAQI